MAGEDRSTAERRLEELFAQHADQVHAYVLHRLDAAAAADVVAETYLVAWRRIEQVRDPALPWLLGVARRLAANEYRRRRRQAATVEALEAVSGANSEAPSAGPEALAIFRSLSERDQEALVLSAWFGLSASEAGRVMGCSSATYLVRLHRARRRLASESSRRDIETVDRPIVEKEA